MTLIDKYKSVFPKIYGNDKALLNKQYRRYSRLLNKFLEYFDDAELYLFSTPGRTEIGGNHTDHNLGRVIAASINLDSIAIASKNNANKVIIHSEIFDKPFIVSLDDLTKIKLEEGTTNSLIRGIAARFKSSGYNIGGFNALMTSEVLQGSGLSSSASVEVLLGNIFNTLFNNDKIKNEELAIIGQYAENNYFGKPCGLMDQMACAVGGIISIDFKDPDKPIIDKVNFDFESVQYSLLIVDTGGSHVDLTQDYSSIPFEMKSVAQFLGKENCREVDLDIFLNRLNEIREKLGDRAVLRAFHFMGENKRVLNQIKALRKNDFASFLKYVTNSGNSSFKWLQNVYSTHNVKEQGLSLALALSEEFISQKGEGACRVHGGGFAGTIQVFISKKDVNEYIGYMEKIFGVGKVIKLNIRSMGTICLNNLK